MAHRAARVSPRVWGPLVGVAIAVACGGEGSAGKDVPKCIPGSTQYCLCVGGDPGVQDCLSTGAFDDCVCGGAVDGGPGATGGASSGGVAGTSGAGGSPGSGSTSGSGGSPGSGGTSGSGGSDGTRPALFTKEEAARVCLAVAACMPAEFEGNFSNANDCINLTGIFSYRSPGTFTAPHFVAPTTFRMQEVYECILGALPDCTAVIACASPDGPVTATPCSTFDSMTDGGSCDGTRRSGCIVDGWSYVVDCARFDQECVDDGLSAARCSFPDCSAGEEEACDGAHVVSCGVSGEHYVEQDCARDGLDCGTSTFEGGTSIECAGGESCDPDAVQDVCEGNVKVECDRMSDDVSGQIVRHACPIDPFEKRCDVDDCVTTGAECDPDQASTCNGSRVQLCDDGFQASYDCTAIGFGACSNGYCIP